MTEEPTDESRRTFMKGAAATGVAATGLAAFSGAASAQNVRNLNVQLSGGVLNISNINALNNIEVSDVVITVIDGDVNLNIQNIANDLDIDVSDVQVVNVENVLNENDVDILNDSFVQVAVAVLGSTGDLVAAGSDAANL